ncbi:MAG: DUF5615 family PIN-like protein [bacterium]|nr:DUF5615 family PIN-like protein [bacterium]
MLLDSAFAKPAVFPKLRKKTNLAHAVHNCSLSFQAEDQEIYQKAQEENRFILTINFKDFRRLVKGGGSGVFGIEAHQTNQEIDQKVTEFLRDKDPKDYQGKAIKI